MNQVVVVFVTHNSADYIGPAVRSCLAQNLPTIVVDNASTDGTVAAIPCENGVKIVQNDTNLGFSGAINVAFRATSEPYVLLLNPDTELLTPIAPLLEAIVQNGHTAAAGLLIGDNGKPQQGFSFRRFPTPTALAFEVLGINRIWPGNPVNRRYRCLDLDPLQPQVVEQPAGACFLIRRSDWEHLAGFDEGFYPVWFEDVDYCRRLVSTGGSIWFQPSVRVLHHGGHSVQKIELGYRQRVWYGSLLKYAAKHFRPVSRRVLAVTVGLAIVPRVLLLRAGESFGSKLENIKFIWRLAWTCFQTGGSTEDRPGRRA